MPEGKPQSELDAALARLERNVQSREQQRGQQTFETDTGFTGIVHFFTDGQHTLRLNRGGQESLFIVHENDVQLREFRGPDGEHLDDPHHSAQHVDEAWRLLDTGTLRKDTDSPNDQLEMDI